MSATDKETIGRGDAQTYTTLTKDDRMLKKIASSILASCSPPLLPQMMHGEDLSGLLALPSNLEQTSEQTTESDSESGTCFGRVTSLCVVLHELKMELKIEIASEGRLLVPGQETKAVSRGRRLGSCDLKYSDHSDLVSTGGWNVWSASCELSSQSTVRKATLKLKKDSAMGGELVVDRQATSVSTGRHFWVRTQGILEVDGITLTGGYGKSVRSPLCYCYFIFLNTNFFSNL